VIGILLVTHENLGASLARCAEHILGAMPSQLASIAVLSGDDAVLVEQRARLMLRSLDQGDGVLVFTDIVGATPYNATIRLMEPGHIEGLAGVNLPMLMRALTYRNTALADVLEKASSGAIAGIVRVPPC
jgi:PTS system ascorbate-specific IIA component